MASALIAGLDRGWAALAAAVGDRASPLRLPVVATAGGGGADARVIVLRGVDRAAARLTFFTDVRAAKVAAVADDPRVAVLAYDPVADLQLRLRGTAAVASAGGQVDAAWAQVPVAARRAYRTVDAPGSGLPSPEFDEGWDGREHFAVLTVAVDRFEWLDLGGSSHRRAVAICRDGRWTTTWVVP